MNDDANSRAPPRNPHTQTDQTQASAGNTPVLVVVEGINDIEFLRRISRVLHSHDATMPNLADMERRGELVFLPCGGAVLSWTHRLEPLGLSELVRV